MKIGEGFVWCRAGIIVHGLHGSMIVENLHVSGTYLDETGGVDENSCKECPEGYYCPESAQVST